MKDGVLDELLQMIEEQAEFIMRQADRISKLSAILLEHFNVSQEEINEIKETKGNRK